MKGTKLQSITAAAALAAGVLSAPSASADEMFLRLGKIQGEVTIKSHLNEIDVLSWSWGYSAPAGGGAAGCSQGINILKSTDTASPQLIVGATIGTTYPDGRLTIQSTDGTDYLWIDLSGVSILSFQISGSSSDPAKPTESIQLKFAYADLYYRKQNSNGSYASPLTARVYWGAC